MCMGVALKGVIVKGFGEGKYYMAMQKYKAQFKAKLGFAPYEGTLNIKAEKDKVMKFLSGLKAIKINGFKTKQRSFGGLKAYKVRLNGERIGLIIPDRTSHEPDTVELIAKFNIKEKFGLKDGNKVAITQ